MGRSAMTASSTARRPGTTSLSGSGMITYIVEGRDRACRQAPPRPAGQVVDEDARIGELATDPVGDCELFSSPRLFAPGKNEGDQFLKRLTRGMLKEVSSFVP